MPQNLAWRFFLGPKMVIVVIILMCTANAPVSEKKWVTFIFFDNFDKSASIFIFFTVKFRGGRGLH